MDIEQLKLILEVVGAASDGAKDLALLWLGLAFFKSTIGWGFGFTVLYAAYRLARRAIIPDSLLGTIGELAGIGYPISRKEQKEVLRIVNAGLAKIKTDRED